jgi:membrane protein implicated in regulation of membrane protease activity
MYEQEMTLLGKSLTLKVIDTDRIDTYNVLAVTKDGDGYILGSYIATIDAVSLDKPKVIELVDEYRHQTGGALKFVIVVSDAIIWVVNTFMSILTSVFGGIGGFGLIGIAVVLGVLFMILMVWVYALTIIIPFAVLAYGAKIWLQKTHEEGIRSISRTSRELGKQYVLLHKTTLDNDTYQLNSVDDRPLNHLDSTVDTQSKIPTEPSVYDR